MNNKEFSQFYSDYVNTSDKFNLDITYICPLKCPFCIRQLPGGKERIKNSSDITINNFVKILKKSNHISFCGQISDPIYHKDFISIMKLVSENKHKSFSFNTNGTRKSVNWWKTVFSMSHKNVTWIFGLDGTDQETANKYRINTRFDEVLNIMKLGSSMNVNIIWQFIVFKHNQHQIELAKKLALENSIKFEILKSNRWQHKELMKKHNIEPPSEEWISNRTEQKIIFYN